MYSCDGPQKIHWTKPDIYKKNVPLNKDDFKQNTLWNEDKQTYSIFSCTKTYAILHKVIHSDKIGM